MSQTNSYHPQKGFTLIELLVVIAILAVLATAVVLVLNPAELVRQGRDSTRMSDLAALNGAIALWVSDVVTTTWPTNTYICTGSTSDTNTCKGNTLSSSTAINGTGWVPLNFNAISSGSPLSKLPLDPNNGTAGCRLTSSGNPTSTCQYAFYAGANIGEYELNAAMESMKYSNGGGGDVVSKDGGNNPYLYEVGGKLDIKN